MHILILLEIITAFCKLGKSVIIKLYSVNLYKVLPALTAVNLLDFSGLCIF